MKWLSGSAQRNGSGRVVLQTEDLEDLWQLYNLVQVNDKVSAETSRRIQKPTLTGAPASERINIRLCIKVEKFDFDSKGGFLHLNGQVCVENKHVRIGAYHTLDLGISSIVSLEKEEWDRFDMQRLKSACEIKHKAEIGAVILEPGLANVCLLTTSMTLVQAKIRMNVLRKQGSSHKSMQEFFQAILQAMLTHLDLNNLKVVIVASPGFLNQEFLKYLQIESSKSPTLHWVTKLVNKFLLVNCSSGHVHSLSEVLRDQKVQAQVKNTLFMKQSRKLDDFQKMLIHNENKAWYGKDQVNFAVKSGAVSHLLILDNLLKFSSIDDRKFYCKLVDNVENCGGKVFIFSSLHESGQQLEKLTGIAAILSFPLDQDLPK